jgi:RND family efflux transporter MFP subunit
VSEGLSDEQKVGMPGESGVSGGPGAADPGIARDLDTLRIVERPDPLGPGARDPRRRWPILVLLALVGAAIAAGLAFRQLSRPPEVELVAVSQRDFGAPPAVLTASGYVVARRQITVSSKAQGRIVEMPVEENQQIAKGDLIARLEDDEQRASLSLAGAEFADAERELGRKRLLLGRGTVSQIELDRAETAFRVAEARLALARVALGHTVIEAPISGTVIRKIRDEGEFLTIGVTAEGAPGSAVVTLADLSAIDVALEIGETEIRKVERDAVALVTPEALRDRRYLADVIEVAAMADRQKGVVPVKIRIRDPDPELLPDMTAVVAFLEAPPEGEIEVLKALPASAVARRDGASVVFVVEDERARAVPVRTRPVDEEWVVLLEGPEEGTYVVESPPTGLRSGQPVRMRAP